MSSLPVRYRVTRANERGSNPGVKKAGTPPPPTSSFDGPLKHKQKKYENLCCIFYAIVPHVEQPRNKRLRDKENIAVFLGRGAIAELVIIDK